MRLKDEKGFSLVEIITVIAIIGILAAIAVPNYFSWRPNMRLKAAARNLYSNMQKARMQAVKENQSISLRFDSSTTPGFYYFDMNGDAAHNPGEYRVELSTHKDVDYGSGNAANNWNNTAITQAAVITFNPQGTANSASIFLSNIKNASTCYAVTSQISGSIKLRKYSGITPFDINGWD